MKKYSTTYPLVFGIIYFIVGFCAAELFPLSIFGAVLIVVAIVMKRKESKDKKEGKETSTEKLNRMYREVYQQANLKSDKPRKKYRSCTICRKSVLESEILFIGAQRLCPDCAKGYTPNPKPVNVVLPKEKSDGPRKKYRSCTMCRKSVLESEILFIGDQRLCPDCAKGYTPNPKPVNVVLPKEKSDEPRKKYRLCTRCKKTVLESEILLIGGERLCPDCVGSKILCSVCRQSFVRDELIFADGEYYCKDCYSFMQDHGKKEAEVLTEGLKQVGYEISGIRFRTPYTQLIDVADCLVAGEFEFSRAGIGGASKKCEEFYTDYYNFKDKGKLNNLNYEYVQAFFARGTLKVCVASEKDNIILRWIDESDKMFAATEVFAKKVVKEVFDGNCVLKKIDDMELDSEFLENWG